MKELAIKKSNLMLELETSLLNSLIYLVLAKIYLISCSLKQQSLTLIKTTYYYTWGRRGSDRMAPVPITTKVVSSNPAHGEVYWIQHF
jgi:hypothetical protein